MIEFNKVTWYSRLCALVLFLLVLPSLSFYLGMQFERFIALEEDLQRDAAQLLLQPVAGMGEKIAEAHYLCDAGKTLDAAYYEGPATPPVQPGEMPHPNGKVSISIDGADPVILMQTLSASGIRYANADESLVFWSKGDEALIMRDNAMDLAYTNCSASR